MTGGRPHGRRPAATPPHPSSLPLPDLLAACAETRTRRGGPGGQHRNKVETAVVLRHLPSGVSAEAAERRSQAENRAVAARRLRLRLAVAVRSEPLPGSDHAPSDTWHGRTRAARLMVAESHDDYPTLLAEALDGLAAAGWEPRVAAARLGVSATQIVRLVAKHPPALAMVNERRAATALHPLR